MKATKLHMFIKVMRGDSGSQKYRKQEQLELLIIQSGKNNSF